MTATRRLHAGRYEYPIEACDVADKPRLARFREKRGEWLQWLHDDEHHAIVNTLCQMLWSDALFRLVNESRNHAHDAGGEFATLNSGIAQLIDAGYVHEQLATIRRLLESGLRNGKPKRDSDQVISLQRLIEDVKANRDLITREMFVAFDGLPYDYAPVRDAELAKWAKEGGGVRHGATRGPLAWNMAAIQHRTFDRLSGIEPDARARNDSLSDAAFQRVADIMDRAPFEKATRFLNKTIAHAAAPSSRSGAPLDGVALNDLWACHEALVKATARISAMFVGGGIASVPTPQYDVMHGWAAPFVPPERMEALYRQWQDENEARWQWGHDY